MGITKVTIGTMDLLTSLLSPPEPPSRPYVFAEKRAITISLDLFPTACLMVN